jgi:hypothetical protein
MTQAQGHEVIEVHVGELKQLFNAMDPSPFRERDLDPSAEEFIVSWARELAHKAPLALLVHVDRAPAHPDDGDVLRAAIREFFGYRAQGSRRQVRQLLKIGRVSLLIGLGCLALSIGLGDLLAGVLGDRPLAGLLRESILIGGWVAMWRPLEIFLYDWWPIRAHARLYDRLAAMPVQVVHGGGPAV